MARASVAGHLIECGAQVTGAYSTTWQGRDLAVVGYPIAELANDGVVVITKPPDSGGVVDRHSVVEQLVYEIGDPQHYLTPDVDVDFSTVQVEIEDIDRVRVTGALGQAPPDAYKVSLAYQNGYTASATLVVTGRDAEEKARTCAEIVFTRLAIAGFDFAKSNVELLGAGDAIPQCSSKRRNDAHEIVLRIAVQDERREAVNRFRKEIAPLITSGPAGLAGYAVGRSPLRPVYAYWPTTIPKDCVSTSVEVRTAKDWL